MMMSGNPYYWSVEEKRRFSRYVDRHYHRFNRKELVDFAVYYRQLYLMDVVFKHDLMNHSRINTYDVRSEESRKKVIYRPVCISNCIPIIAQIKSFGIVIFDWNMTRAMRVQGDFFNTMTIISQLKSLRHLLIYKSLKSCDVQKNYFQYVGAILDNIPRVGFVKAAIHYIMGDRDSGYRAFRTSTRMLFVRKCASYGYEPIRCIIFGAISGILVDMVLPDDNENSHNQHMYCKADNDEVGGFEKFIDGLTTVFPITGWWAQILSRAAKDVCASKGSYFHIVYLLPLLKFIEKHFERYLAYISSEIFNNSYLW